MTDQKTDLNKYYISDDEGHVTDVYATDLLSALAAWVAADKGIPTGIMLADTDE